MKKYFAYFRMRFLTGIQYRAAALGGLICQFFWGAMAILAFRAFYDTDPAAFPMTIEATASYIWLQQALLTLLSLNGMSGEIFGLIHSGNVAYELCRPVGVYPMWFARSAASRVSAALLRCWPTLLVAACIPAPYGLAAPAGPGAFALFLISLALAAAVATSFSMIVYMITFHTISPRGVRLIAISVSDFFMGSVVPLPFFPDGVRRVVELLPFSCMANVPLRIYSGDIRGGELLQKLLLQIFWTAALVFLGLLIERREIKRVVVQGG